MFNKNEIAYILTTSLVLGFVLSLNKTVDTLFIQFLYATLAICLVILVNTVAKKITGFFLETEIDIKLWELQRFGYKKHHKFKKPIPIGIILPLMLSVLSYGYVTWLSPLVFDVKAKASRAVRKWGLYKFSEVTEWHMGVIAAMGIFANLAFAVVGYLMGYEDFARLNIYFAFFNVLPLGKLDGNKIFFGSIVLWSFIAALVFIFLGYAILVI